MAFRNELLAQGREGLTVSQQKAATVAAEAPGYAERADEGKAESGPMAGEAGGLAAENAANTPDDEEAAANAREQGGQMDEAGRGIATTDDAITQTQARARSLGRDAALAEQKNIGTGTRLDTMQATLGATADKLGQMTAQSSSARGQMESLAHAPDTHTGQADTLQDEGGAINDTSRDIEGRLQAVQTGYAASMAAVPAVEPWTREKVVELYGRRRWKMTNRASSPTR